MHEPNSEAVKASYGGLRNETVAQLKELKSTGLKFEAWKGEGEPYASSKEMMADVRDNNHMWYFKTEKSFGGGQAPVSHPMLEDIGSGMVVNDGLHQICRDNRWSTASSTHIRWRAIKACCGYSRLPVKATRGTPWVPLAILV